MRAQRKQQNDRNRNSEQPQQDSTSHHPTSAPRYGAAPKLNRERSMRAKVPQAMALKDGAAGYARSMASSSHGLRAFLERHERLLVLTGAGCSTESGIPDYRDAAGAWKRAQPMLFQLFMQELRARQRYWARSLLGWLRFRRAAPNGAHHALARLEREGRIELLVTQNVDRLHQAAGSRAVLDLHGQLDEVRCMSCGARVLRESLQQQLLARNPAWSEYVAREAPDGDADLDGYDFSSFEVSACDDCGGILKPDVVFFGETVPPERVERAMQHLLQADALLVVGSSLMVYSGYRFAQAAAGAGKPIAAVNLGRTRADALLALKVELPCTQALATLG
jgi:NAD-dependent SIR2 family protein deacetylase